MAYLNCMSFLSRRCFSTKMCSSKVFLTRPADFSFFKSMTSYSNANSFKVLNTNKKSIAFLNLKSGGSYNKLAVKVDIRRSVGVSQHSRYFHTSERRYLHPVVWVVLRPVLKLLAIITGRAFRKWWRELPPNKRKYFLQQIKENKLKIAIFILSCAALSAMYYLSHLEETPITKRKRFIAFNPEQLKKINELEFQQMLVKMEDKLLPVNHPSTHRVKAVVNRILEENRDIKEIKGKKWGVSVINSPLENAFVIPMGHVFVFTGMLNLCSNDDELAIILSHEIAHCIQNHGAENVSLHHLLDLASILIIAAIWAIIPSDTLSLLTHWLYHKSVQVFLELPYNRSIETEADFVGLQLAAKACFDVRESSAFWAKMAFLHSTAGNPEIEFLSTHPSHEKRSEYLDSIMDQAINLRFECGCPQLKPVDPRLNTVIMAKALDASRKKYLSQFPEPIVKFHI